ncbi:hypothetical protein [uncultured Murdochiella sp.]|nr:hypothetical protein [uncultured Murdochiella sp.]
MKSAAKKDKNTVPERNRKGHAIGVRVLALILAVTMVLGILVAAINSLGI